VLIYNLVDGIFFAKLICNNGEKTVEIDARTSDAIALAVRFNCPIYTYEFILSSAGIIIEGDDFVFLENIDSSPENIGKKESPASYASFSETELQEKLQQALSDEAYEKAAKIRDEIIKRKSS
jgi:bifunctional DNase/RNase